MSAPASRSPGVRMRDMSFVFIECDEIKRLFPAVTTVCCNNCHNGTQGQNRIYVTPWKDDGVNTDWAICVQAIVCCAIYDFVRALPRSWWEEQAVRYNVGRDDGRGYKFTDNPQLNTERSTVYGAAKVKYVPRKGDPVSTVKRIKESLADARAREEEGGIGSWRK